MTFFHSARAITGRPLIGKGTLILTSLLGYLATVADQFPNSGAPFSSLRLVVHLPTPVVAMGKPSRRAAPQGLAGVALCRLYFFNPLALHVHSGQFIFGIRHE